MPYAPKQKGRPMPPTISRTTDKTPDLAAEWLVFFAAATARNRSFWAGLSPAGTPDRVT